MGQPVVHLVSIPLNGHIMNPTSDNACDCWCEPANIYWVYNRANVKVLIVEHNDYTLKHRIQQLQERDRGIPAELAWIDHALYAPASYPSAPHRDWPPKLLPPPERGIL
jgi:hypothetical protein